MNNITKNQNEERNILFLKAQRVAYNKAKNFQFVDIVTIVIAIIFPIVTIVDTHTVIKLKFFSEILAILGGLWVLVALILEFFRKKLTIVGANIQEQFDTEVFEMEWNMIQVGKKCDISTITHLGNQYNKNDLKDWYSTEICNSLPQSIAISFCQKINAIWEHKLRRKFALMIGLSIMGYYFLLIGYTFFVKLNSYDIILLIAPSFSFLVFGILTIKSQVDIANSKDRILELTSSFWDDFLKDGKEPSTKELRQIQNMIYEQRRTPHKIPNFFYRYAQKELESLSDATVKGLLSSFNNTK